MCHIRKCLRWGGHPLAPDNSRLRSLQVCLRVALCQNLSRKF